MNSFTSILTHKDAAIEEEHHDFEETFATHLGCCFCHRLRKQVK